MADRSFILRAKKKKFVALCAIRSNFYVRKSSKQLMQLTTSTMTIINKAATTTATTRGGRLGEIEIEN